MGKDKKIGSYYTINFLALIQKVHTACGSAGGGLEEKKQVLQTYFFSSNSSY
ncbi:MAG: hypothetical protein ACI9XO_004153 [Paraglaciecola sp.]|jgi:hypothetical protein